MAGWASGPPIVLDELIEQADDNQQAPRTLDSLLDAFKLTGVESFADEIRPANPISRPFAYSWD